MSVTSIEDDVAVIPENQAAPKFIYTENLELQQPPFTKFKSNTLLKLVAGKGWAKIAQVNLFVPKCVQMPDQSVYIVGGAKD